MPMIPPATIAVTPNPVAAARTTASQRRWGVFLVARLAGLLIASPAALVSAALPNIVIITADDLGWGDLGCYGHPSIRTPHLDRMAAEGVRFTDFYSAGEVCTPSRTALLTGRYAARSGMCHDRFRVLRAKSLGHLPEAEVTLAELLRERGYATACIGKWHLGSFANNPAGHPLRHGFDSFFGLPHSNDMDPTPQAPQGAPGRADQDPAWWNAPLWRNETLVEQPLEQSLLTQRTIDEAVGFIDAKAGSPFFLYVPLSFPHVPLFASEAFRGKSLRGQYGDVVEELDAGVGRILAALSNHQIAENTLVVFTSDNGPWLTMGSQGGSAGLLRDGKGSTWEGGMRVPGIAWWPGRIRPGRVHRGVATALDLFTTSARLAGGEVPADRAVDGVDLSPVLFHDGPEEPAGVARKAFFYYRGQRVFAVRSGRWKAHLLTQGAYGDPAAVAHDPPLLFDLAADPGERFNLAAEQPEVVALLVALAQEQVASFAPPPSQLVATTDDPAKPVPPTAGGGERRLPPKAPPLEELVAQLDAAQRAAWQRVPGRLERVLKRVAQTQFPDAAVRAEVEVFPKAVQYGIACGEWWEPSHLERATWALDEAERRLDEVAMGRTTWREGGFVPLAYRSSLDGSVQPFGIIVPEGLDRSQPVPVWIWLHGRGERDTDLHFLWQKSRKSGEFFPADAIVLLPFGRYCNGWKGPGVNDVFEALDALAAIYPIDRDRVVLAGFSMGGAGAWEIGARRSDRFCAVHGGAGFVDTERFMGIAPEDVPWWEARLWLLSDVPPVARNLLNLPVIAYSGEKDTQRAASEIMVASLAAEGKVIPHVIGAGMGHQYDDPSRQAIAAFLAPAVVAGRPRNPAVVHWAGTTLADGGMHWVEPVGLAEHCARARVDAERSEIGSGARILVGTENVTAVAIKDVPAGCKVLIDGETIDPAGSGGTLTLARAGLAATGAWGIVDPEKLAPRRKRPGLTGPIDEAFNAPFIVVPPSGPGINAQVDRFVQGEFEHLRRRWHDLFRGELPVVEAGAVTAQMLRDKHLVLFGDQRSNALVARVLPGLPLLWNSDTLSIGPGTPAEGRFPAAHHVPVLIHPNPLSPPTADGPGRYVVLNSGFTFREEDDKSNALQNPRLPDWAVIDLSVPPDGQAPGRVVAADFFDEAWEMKLPR
ncbi:MAG: hypothetical protein DWH79_08770 [Planctomycetota bacterium]|nr:MAG: hypothetical protein DWH79_08770 [Planctomycetota bacterium]